ncbi:MAG: membrane protein [uncultured bacterium]|nr:MAG: membrane protein [uncultured bacterium]
MDLSFSIIFLAVFLGFAPGIFWLWFYRQRDVKNPEPNKLMLYLFLGGMASTIPAALAQFGIQKLIPIKYLICLNQGQGCDLNIGANIIFIFIMMFVIVAPLEEISKYVFVKWIAFKSNSFNQIVDGIKYSVAVALGFASLENALYLIGSLARADFDTVVSTLIVRFFISTLAHTLYAGILGYYLGMARFDKLEQKKLLRTGLILAIVVHGAFNFLLYTQLGFYSIILVAIVFFALIQKFKNKELTRRQEIAISPGVKRVPQESTEKGLTGMIEESKRKEKEGNNVTISEFCPKCLVKNEHGAKYCPNCGEKLFIKIR